MGVGIFFMASPWSLCGRSSLDCDFEHREQYRQQHMLGFVESITHGPRADELKSMAGRLIMGFSDVWPSGKGPFNLHVDSKPVWEVGNKLVYI